MLKLAMRRLALAPLLLAAVTFLLFVLVSIIPGDPAVALAGSNLQLVPMIREALGLDLPLVQRYLNWVGNVLAGDLGRSFQAGHAPVWFLLSRALPITLALVLVAMSIAIVATMLLGTASAVFQGRIVDRAITTFCAVAIATPTFWLGYLLVLWLAVGLNWLPSLGYRNLSDGFWPWLSHLLLPAFTLAPATTAVLTLQLRGAFIEVLGRPYILSGRAKGLTSPTLIFKHALKNAAVPVVTLLGYQISSVIGGSVLVEHVFSLPGIGTLVIDSTLSGDLPVILGIVTVTTALVVSVNSLTDIAYGYLNPRVR